jgi:hypothetical protein
MVRSLETHEQVGGFLLIEARDLNKAIELASRMPAASLGGIEVRPVRELASIPPGSCEEQS